MTEEKMIELVRRYFNGVDQQSFDEIAATLNENCIFTVETHGVKLHGYDEVSTMFTRLWANHRSVEHKDFTYVADSNRERIATQFTVVNTELDGDLTYKSNCNFFSIVDGKFSHVAVYMTGQNTLDKQ
jgi:limonene-1,2-epoxide hydrolase